MVCGIAQTHSQSGSTKYQAHLQRLSSIPPAANNKGLLSLPDELLLDIIDLPMFSLEELTALAITCRRLFELMSQKVQDARDCNTSRWAGSRIVCIGDNTTYEGLPATLLKKHQRAVIDAKIKQEMDQQTRNYGGLPLLGLEYPRLFRGVFTLDWYYSRFLRKLSSQSKADLEMFKTVLAVTYPPLPNWALFNIDKHEFVRASAIAELCGKPNDPQPFLPSCRIDLGHALLTRISWSDEELVSTSRTTKVKMDRGPWVGDRFYIATIDRRSIPEEGEEPWEWKDVSAEVVRDLARIYRAVFGKEWLAKVEGNVADSDFTVRYWFGSDGDDDVAVECREVMSPRLYGCFQYRDPWAPGYKSECQ